MPIDWHERIYGRRNEKDQHRAEDIIKTLTQEKWANTLRLASSHR